MSQVTIVELPARLRLVRIPKQLMKAKMSEIIECWWFRAGPGSGADSFFTLCVNSTEISIFADALVVEKCFGLPPEPAPPTPLPPAPALDAGGSSATLSAHDDEDVPFDSAFTAVPGVASRGASPNPGDPATEEVRATRAAGKQPETEVGDSIWVALQIDFHGDGWEEAGQRVKELSSPLAREGISILFVSTFISDYILVKEYRLQQVVTILTRQGFNFSSVPGASDDEEEDEEPTAPFHREGPGLLRRSSSTRSKGAPSLAGSLIMSERSAGSGSGSPAGKRGTESPVEGMSAFYEAVGGGGGAGPNSPALLRAALHASNSSEDRSPFSPGDSLSVLPDELVCVSLVPEYEVVWRSKIVQALFYPERTMPPTLEQERKMQAIQMARSAAGEGEAERSALAGSVATIGTTLDQARGRSLNSSMLLRMGTSVLASPHSRSSASHSTSTNSHGTSSQSPKPAALTRTLSSSSSTSSNSDFSVLPALTESLSTESSDYPIPFFALTQTVEGTSLLGDVRLLRAVFSEEDEALMVRAVGEGGLRGIWEGEVDSPDSDDEDEQDGEGRGRRPKRYLSEDFARLGLVGETEEQRERREEAKRAGEGGRHLLKCLSLDLNRFGLDKHGIVDALADALVSENINLMYCSTFASANILVAKRDMRRARRALEARSQLSV